MKRFRTGRPAPPWAGGQTGPMTVDVEALMATRNQDYRYMPGALDSPTSQPTPPSPSAEAAEATNEPDEPADTGPFRTVKLVYVGPGSEHAPAGTEKISPSRTVPPVEAEPAEEHRDPLEGHPSLKAFLEKHGTPLPPSARAKSSASRLRAKAKRAKPKRNLLAARKSRRPSVPRKQSQPKTQAEIDLDRHRRVCTICHHPEREAIEEAFLQWKTVRLIAREFDASGGATSIYRHARALNLFKQRNLNLRSALELIIEESQRVSPSAEAIIKAIRAHTRMNDLGEWIDPPTTHIIKVIPMARDARDQENPAAALTLDVRKDRSNIVYPPTGQVESVAKQQLLPGSAQNAESDVTP
ncbi:MAG: hypothetical protein WCD49_05395 [Candidatus Acidiferrales bacterium]